MLTEIKLAIRLLTFERQSVCDIYKRNSSSHDNSSCQQGIFRKNRYNGTRYKADTELDGVLQCRSFPQVVGKNTERLCHHYGITSTIGKRHDTKGNQKYGQGRCHRYTDYINRNQ